MEIVEHTIVHYAHGEKWPTNLKSAAEAADELGISEERLMELALAGYAPHWKVDGGPPQFRMQELKAWGARNLTIACGGRPLEVQLRVEVAPLACNNAPDSICDIPELVELPCAAQPGIYFLVKNHEVVYVGQSISPLMRIGTHGASQWKDFDQVFMFPVPQDLLNKVEGALIRWLRPPLNSQVPREYTPGADDEVIEQLFRYKPKHLAVGRMSA